MFFVAKKDYSESNHQSSGTVGTVHVCVGVLVVFWIFYPHVMCKLFCHFLSKLLGCCTVSIYVQQSVRTSLSVNSFTIEVNSKITTSSLFAYCWLGRKNKPGNLAQCKTEKYFQGIRILIFTTISTVFGSNHTCPMRQIAFCSTLLITYTSDFVTPASCVPDAKKLSTLQNN